MKTRNGFVSNSSTSSFVVVVTKTDHEDIMKEIGEECADLLKDIIIPHNFGDLEVIATGDLNNDVGSSYTGNPTFDFGEESEEFYDALWAYRSASKEKNALRISLDL